MTTSNKLLLGLCTVLIAWIIFSEFFRKDPADREKLELKAQIANLKKNNDLLLAENAVTLGRLEKSKIKVAELESENDSLKQQQNAIPYPVPKPVPSSKLDSTIRSYLRK